MDNYFDPYNSENDPSVYEQEYLPQLKRQKEKANENCTHPHWIQKCSVCQKILCSDATDPSKGIIPDMEIEERKPLISMSLINDVNNANT